MGNRLASQVDVSPNQMVTTYTSNELNQYQRLDVAEGDSSTPRAAQLLEHDPDGNRETTNFLGDLNCDGAFDASDISPFALATSDCPEYMVQYPNCDCLRADMNGDGTADGNDFDAFLALLFGTTERATPYVSYVWDAENRLSELGPSGSPMNGDVKLEYVYDYMGRRVERKVSTWNGTSWDLTQRRKFVWAAWLMLMEMEPDDLVTPTTDDTVRKYTWGLDLSESLQGAGGIGGLLAALAVYWFSVNWTIRPSC